MHEAVDYNAFSWVRQEIELTIRKAQTQLREYVHDTGKPVLLQGCAELLHQIRGPLKIAGLTGSDLLASEIESLVADLKKSGPDKGADILESLQQALGVLSSYLSRLQSSEDDTPDEVMPYVNQLRGFHRNKTHARNIHIAVRSATLPAGIFHGGGSVSREMSLHAVRVRFQSALLSWYRNGLDAQTTCQLLDVLMQLQENAGTESEARLWWVASGIADALRTGLLDDSIEFKRLFGRLDRQIKYFMDDRNFDCNDDESVSLIESMLQYILEIDTDTCADRIASIVKTFRREIVANEAMGEFSTGPDSDAYGGVVLSECVAHKYTTDVTDGNCQITCDNEVIPNETVTFTGLPAASHSDSNVNYQEILRGISICKGGIEDYLKDVASGDSLRTVSAVLPEVRKELADSGLDRTAIVVARVQDYISTEMLESAGIPGDDELDRLADAICSVEFYLEGLRDGRIIGDRIIALAEENIAKLGYPVSSDETPSAAEAGILDGDFGNECSSAPELATELQATPVTVPQVVDPEADKEILEIFFEESEEILRTLNELVSGLGEESLRNKNLDEIARCLHTLKGNSRMLGAFPLGDIAYSLENVINAACNGVVNVDQDFRDLLLTATTGLVQLLAQIKNPALSPDIDINAVLSQLDDISKSKDSVQTCPAEKQQDAETQDRRDQGQEITSNADRYQVLAPDADPEIVEIFIEEAMEEIAILEEIIPPWASEPEVNDDLVHIRRIMHTLKGSGRMAGAMMTGEFSLCMENLLNRLIEGSLELNGSIMALVIQLPDTLQQLIEQLRNGSAPTADIDSIMAEAGAQYNGKAIADSETSVCNSIQGEPVTLDPGAEQDTVLEAPADEADPELLQIYIKEACDILSAVRDSLNSGDANNLVSEPVYRGLHTLSGISESAEITSIAELASELARYFGNLYQSNSRMSPEAQEVLQESVEEISSQVAQLPDTSCDNWKLDELCDRLARLPVLPEVVAESGLTCSAAGELGPNSDTQAEPGLACHGTESAVGYDQIDQFSSVDQELYEAFLEESGEIIDASERVLHEWVENPDNTNAVVELQRHLHTLKGSARMMNIAAIGDLSHSLETLLTRVSEGTVSVSDDLFAALFLSQDMLSEMLDQVRQRSIPEISADLESTLERLARLTSNEDAYQADLEPDHSRYSETEPVEYVQSEESAEFVLVAESKLQESMLPAAGNDYLLSPDRPLAGTDDSENGESDSGQQNMPQLQNVGDDDHTQAEDQADFEYSTIPLNTSEEPLFTTNRKPAKRRGEVVKVQSELLDDLVNFAGEINIYRTRMEAQIGDYRFNLGELEQTIGRLREQLRKLEIETETQILYRYEHADTGSNQDFDPLELDRYSNLQEYSRSLMESISDLYSLMALMANTTRDSETLLLQQSRVSTDLQEGLMRTRMIPFANLETRLRRIIRQSARQLGKTVELELQGADGEMDRAVIDRITAPLEHMLRNAVAHGIEMPDERRRLGKDETGKISITFDREGPDIVLCIEDDGSGMDVDAIREKAVEKGLLEAGGDLSENDVIQFVLQAGFSTATQITQISGRGVGLDVVNSEVKQLGGSLHIESIRGASTRFTIRLPYTLAINQALLVSAGMETYCIPLGNVEAVVRVEPRELLSCYASDDPLYEYGGNQYQLKHLATLLNTAEINPKQMSARVPVLLMRIGERRIALHVEALFGSREIVIKPVGMQLSSIDGLSGATILGDGRVVMILDVFALMRNTARAQHPSIWSGAHREKRLCVMVVDDSITVRKVTTRLLERNGYKVQTAKDGVDAIGKLQDNTPDIMLLDIEMPRMDGFELAIHMRNDERLKRVPIVMITSRTGDKHRERARLIGVNNYLGKPYQESDLLETIDRIIRIVPDSVEIGSHKRHAG